MFRLFHRRTSYFETMSIEQTSLFPRLMEQQQSAKFYMTPWRSRSGGQEIPYVLSKKRRPLDHFNNILLLILDITISHFTLGSQTKILCDRSEASSHGGGGGFLFCSPLFHLKTEQSSFLNVVVI